jgi:hypothetical protein
MRPGSAPSSEHFSSSSGNASEHRQQPGLPFVLAKSVSDSRKAPTRHPCARAGDRLLHRLIGREELRDLHVGQVRPDLRARLSQELAVNHGDDRKDGLT